ncbi:guanitoxin biosynthesis MATE family efflux transporter GntT [Roseofilum casamattae]|uniref:Guanitoxin biosynthesis MATE family efflux transporter GntT n=1 Tax=Roseofilum casamattae BLCC-M143 TaxID=3022442 RepID=A0ABT7BWS2_9CYAN|nr:guanitoxin biosynthesis MATE family efflux transporter GntT [Roseofilum casamattae]MDJ1183262.1 guanitoxin biosynthesis MATE family efflux transporter GntT [Roseofilum casamattae BLCC-M143]
MPYQSQSFLPRFYRLASISILSNMMVPLAGLCDSAFLGHLSNIKHLAGVILASILFDYLYRIFKFLRTSTNSITAEAVGRDDRKDILLALLRSGAIAFTIGAVIVLLAYPIQAIGFTILAGSNAIESSAVEYFNARIVGAPAVLLNFVLIGWFLGREKNAIVLLMSIVGNGSNVLLDYLFIYRWDWASSGAGLATALSQILALMVALIAVSVTVSWKELPNAISNFFNTQALRSTLSLKWNILIRFLVLISTYAIFTNLSAMVGTNTLVENGLLLQIALLSQFTIQGIGMTEQTLISNFNGKQETEKFLPVFLTSVIHSLPIAFMFAAVSFFFPKTIFGLLTSQPEINASIADYTIWLFPLLLVTAIAFMMEGYFIGLKQGVTLRNSVLIAFFIGFLPLAIIAANTANPHLLWLALTLYMVVLATSLGIQLFQNERREVSEPLAS